jgi:serine/threonine protein kinase
MICTACRTDNEEAADACFTCGKALYVLTQGMLLGGRYEIQSALGTGGMGRVYQARDRVLDEDVAIKVLRFEISREQDMARRFLSEIKLARRVSHPNVCRIHEYGEHAGIRFISMEYIDGLTLKEFLRGGFLSREAAFDVAIQAALGLQAVHDMGVIHRDFKASNIMIDSRGVARLVDFGIAKHAAHDATTSGPVFGTPEYMSPEQVRGGKLDFRSDIYALGCVIYEIFAGQAPFRGENPMDTVMKQLHDPLPVDTAAARRIPASVVPVIQRAMAKAPSARYSRVADVTEALRAAREVEGLAAPAARPLAVVQVDGAVRKPAVAGGGAPDRRPSTDAPAAADTPPLPRSPETHTLRHDAPPPARGDDRPPTAPRSPRSRGQLVGSAVAALAVAAFGWRAWTGRPRPEEPKIPPTPAPAVAVTTLLTSPPPSALPVATLLASPPPSAAPSPTPRASAAAPLPSPAASVAPVRRPPSPAAVTPWTVLTPPPPPRPASTLPVAVDTGTLRLRIVPEAEVVLDGASLGRVSVRELTLEAGPHTLRVLHADYEPLQRKVTVRPGAVTPLVLDLAEKAIPRQR